MAKMSEKTGQQATAWLGGMLLPGLNPGYLPQFNSGWQGAGYLPGQTAAPTPGELIYGTNGMAAITGSPYGIGACGGTMAAPQLLPFTYWTYRRILSDPTVALARAVTMAPLMLADWSFEPAADAPKSADRLVKFVEAALRPFRHQFTEDAARCWDLGWAGFEIVYGLIDGKKIPVKLKPLLHEITTIDVDEHGNFAGLTNAGVQLPRNRCMILTYDGESGNLYGRSRLENLRMTMAHAYDAMESLSRYNRKVSGVYVVLHFPPGHTKDVDGKERSNDEIAQRLLQSISSGKSIAVPNEWAVQTGIAGEQPPKETRWRIELLEDKGGRQPTFITHMEYLDKEKARGMGVPERAMLEAVAAGSRADSESHQDIVLVQSELLNDKICRTVTAEVVNRMLLENFGRRTVGQVVIKPAPIVDERREFIQQIVSSVFTAKPDQALRLTKFPELLQHAGIDPADDIEEQLAQARELAQQPEPANGIGVRRSEVENTKEMLSLYSGLKTYIDGLNRNAS